MTPRQLARALLTAACVVVMASTMPVHAVAAPSAGAVFTVSPAHPDALVSSGAAYFVHTVVPGGRWTDEVSVLNTTRSAISAWVDAVDGVTSVRTGAVYSARTLARVRAGAWVRPDVTSVAVAPGMQTTVTFTVTVPVGSSAGDHLAGIAFESKQDSRSAGISTVLRSVVAVQVRVPGAAAFELHLFTATLGPLPTTGTAGVTVDMEDIGGLLGKPQLEISVDGPAAYHRGERLRLDTMLPGDRITDEILWPDLLSSGNYRVSITEDGSGRHSTTLVSTARLFTSVHPPDPVTRSVVGAAPTVRNSFPAWVLFGGLTGGAGATGAAIALVTLARRHRAGHSGALR